MPSMTHTQMLAFALDPKNQGFFNQFYGEPKQMKCYLCDRVSVSHGNNAQPFCKENRQELVCDECNGMVLQTRKFIAEQGGHPYKSTVPQGCLDDARRFAILRTILGYEEDYQRSASPAETSAPTRKTKQTKTQSKRAGRFRDCGSNM